MPADLAGRPAIITGAGRGLGRAIALAFARAGAPVACWARTKAEVEQTAAAAAALGVSAAAVTCDVTDPAQVQAALEQSERAVGDIDILVNNAGAFIVKPVAETALAEFDRIVETNLRAPFVCTKAVLPGMMARRQGCIINIASNAGRKPYIYQGAYTASKHGLVGLSKVLAWEMREYGIRVAAICPGGIDTKLVADARPDLDRTGWMKPEEVAETALFLAALPAGVAIDEVVIRRFGADPQ